MLLPPPPPPPPLLLLRLLLLELLPLLQVLKLVIQVALQV